MYYMKNLYEGTQYFNLRNHQLRIDSTVGQSWSFRDFVVFIHGNIEGRVDIS